MRRRYRNEDGLQAACIRAILREWPDAWILHPHGGMFQRPGLPDLLLCVEGRFVGVELKNNHPGESDQAARERTTPLQRNEIRKINRAGGVARTAITVEETLAAVRAAVAGGMPAIESDEEQQWRIR